MASKEAIEAAKRRVYQCSVQGCINETLNFADALDAFAAERVRHEREECAKICDSFVKTHEAYAETNHLSHVKCLVGDRLAASIRARCEL